MLEIEGKTLVPADGLALRIARQFEVALATPGPVLFVPVGRKRMARVDRDDAELVCAFRWQPDVRKSGTVYARTRALVNGRLTYVAMHHVILRSFGQTDHCDGDGLNNRRGNLRRASTAENCRNKAHLRGAASLFKGVYLDKRKDRWRAAIWLNGQRRHLGRFKSEQEAATAYDQAARFVHGEFARLNFPES